MACILLEGLNLFTGPSKILDEIKFKIKVVFNPKLKEIIDRDYDKENKALGINNTEEESVRGIKPLIVLNKLKAISGL